MCEDGDRFDREASAAEVSVLLAKLAEGDEDSAARLFPLVYGELRALAGSYMRRQRPGHTLQPTALVHEAFLRLTGRSSPPNDRDHFFALAARAMRQVLVDHERRRRAAKRGGDQDRVPLEDTLLVGETEDHIDLLDLDRALAELADLHERQVRVVELRFFGGLTIAETARVLKVTTDTVEYDTQVARAWLRRALRAS